MSDTSPTKNKVSEEAESLVGELMNCVSEASYLPEMYNGPSGDAHDRLCEKRDDAETKLLAYISSLESDKQRIDWLEMRGSIVNGLGYYAIYADPKQTIREAIDAAREKP